MTSEHLIAEAERAVRLGEAVLTELHLGDLELARGWADLLRDHARLLHSRLAEQAPPSPLDRVGRDNPYGPVHVLGMVKEVLARLTTEQVQEYCRETNWRLEREVNPHGRRALGGILITATNELRNRGLHAHSWRDGTEQRPEE